MARRTLKSALGLIDSFCPRMFRLRLDFLVYEGLTLNICRRIRNTVLMSEGGGSKEKISMKRAVWGSGTRLINVFQGEPPRPLYAAASFRLWAACDLGGFENG